jgi:hypothetical protein
MALDTSIVGGTTGNKVEANTYNALKVVPETNAITNSANIGGVRIFSEVDQGYLTNFPTLKSPEADFDYRVRVSQDMLLDDEWFSYTAQNTAKHAYLNTTMTNAWTAGQLTTNSGNITTVTTGTLLNTWAAFPVLGTTTLSLDAEIGFTAQPQANTFIEWGVGLPGTTTTAPTDGVFFRLSSAGLQGIASINGTEVSTGVFPGVGGVGTFTYTNNKRYQFILYQAATEAYFWVDDGTGAVLLGEIELPTATGAVAMSGAGQVFFKQRIVGGAGAATISANITRYNVRQGGIQIATTPSTQGSRLYGSYQALAGSATYGTIAQTGTITTGNEANRTAAVPTTTTAALGTGLGGTFWETVSLAVNTDAIIMSYQVPAGSVNSPARRLVLRGMYLNSYVQTVIVGGPYVAEYFLAFGHTAVSLATAEAGGATATKAPRRIALPFTQVVTAAQAVSTLVSQPTQFVDFGDAPIFVNPGEFIQLCTRHIGTAGTTGTVVHRVVPVYGWE